MHFVQLSQLRLFIYVNYLQLVNIDYAVYITS